MSPPFLGTGRASIAVWISSPVRSRKPVLMNATRELAVAARHWSRHPKPRRRASPQATGDASIFRVRRFAFCMQKTLDLN
jgi:hypothetical protein